MLRKWLLAVCLGMMTWVSGPVQAREVQDIRFDLRDEKGPVTQLSYPGKYLLMAIGYTSCPDICPTTLYEYGEVMKSLRNPDAIQPLFVTIDPDNDEVGRLNAYTRYFDPRIVGLSGEMKEIRALADQLGATFGYRLEGRKLDRPVPGEPYTVYHSALIYLISPDRTLVDVYDYQMGAEGLTEALDQVLGDAQGGVPASAAARATKAAAPAAAGVDAVARQGAAGAVPAAGAAAAAGGQQASADGRTKPGQPEAVQATAAGGRCPLPEGFKPVSDGADLKSVLPQADAGKPVLLNLWALWCAPCRVELPVLARFAASQQQMQVQTLNLGDKPADVAALFQKSGLQGLAQTVSTDKGILKRLGAPGLPFTALFVQGRQVASRAGIINDTRSLARYAACVGGGQP